jgi:hypothetical protein
MNDVASLVIRVQSDGVELAGKRLRNLRTESDNATSATGKLMASWRGLLGFAAGFVGINKTIEGLQKFVQTAKDFESIEARLKTVTGSAENAKEAFQALFDFALKTPYTMKEVTNAFIQMTSYGLNPSEKALRSLGDMASSMGQNMTDIVRAVARAISGEYEPLRTFGVQARKEGDEIALTFRGVTTRMKNDAVSVQSYFEGLGEKFFGGAMLERMKTLEGKLSNLEDAWDRLFYTISKAGIGDVIKNAVDVATNALNELSVQIESGQLPLKLEAWAGKWNGLADQFKEGVGIIVTELSKMDSKVEQSGGYWSDTWKEVKGMFSNFPENVKMLLDSMGVMIGAGIELVDSLIRTAWDHFKSYMANVKDSLVNGFDLWVAIVTNNQAKMAVAVSKADEIASRSLLSQKGFVNDVSTAWGVYIETIERGISTSLDEHDATQKTFTEKIQAADTLREVYDKVAEARKKAFEGFDRLSSFRTGSGGTAATAGFEQMVMAMQTEYQRAKDMYEKRRELIITNTRGTVELLAEEESKYKDNLTRISKNWGLAIQAQKIYFDAQLELINKNKSLTSEARQLAISKLEADNDKQVKAINDKGGAIADALRDAHLNEQAVIKENHKSDDDLRAKLLADNDAKYKDTMRNLADQQFGVTYEITGNEDLDRFAKERADLEKWHEDKSRELEEFRNADVRNEEEYQRRKAFIEKKYADDSRKLQQQKFEWQLQQSADFFGNLSKVAGAFGKKGSKAAKALAIVQTTIETYKSATSAYSAMASIPYVGPVLGAAAAAAAIAAGMKNVQAIRSQDEYAGAYAQGGLIPSGKYGLVGETGQPELVKGPAMVTSASRTAELMGGQNGTNVQVNVINQNGSQVEYRERDESNGKIIDVVIKKAKEAVASDIREGNGTVAGALRSTFPQLKRGA